MIFIYYIKSTHSKNLFRMGLIKPSIDYFKILTDTFLQPNLIQSDLLLK